MDAPRHDPAIRSILVSNVIALAFALASGDGLRLLLWPYWVQSVVIGFFAQRRLRLLKGFSVEGLRINGAPAVESPATKRWTANFFVLHYGLFHLVYALFLGSFKGQPLAGLDWLFLGAAAASFAHSHALSHRANVEADLRGRPNLGTLMFMPYLRIVPMHLTIILGAGLGGAGALAMLLFGALKTAADVAMHVVEHRVLQRSAGRALPVE